MSLQPLILTLAVNTLVTCALLFLALELSKRRREPFSVLRYILLLLGVLALLSSILYESSTLAFIGLGLTFWGALLLYTKPSPQVRADLLQAATIAPLEAVKQVLDTLKIKGKPVYLPPRQLKDFKDGKVLIPKNDESMLTLEHESVENTVFHENSGDIYLTPPGLNLTNLYEDTLGKSFVGTDTHYLETSLPKLFIEDLEIAEDLNMTIEGNRIQVKIAGSPFLALCDKTDDLKNLCASLGCPLSSSIALAIARATSKPTIIEECTPEQKTRTLEMVFRILEQSHQKHGS